MEKASTDEVFSFELLSSLQHENSSIIPVITFNNCWAKIRFWFIDRTKGCIISLFGAFIAGVPVLKNIHLNQLWALLLLILLLKIRTHQTCRKNVVIDGHNNIMMLTYSVDSGWYWATHSKDIGHTSAVRPAPFTEVKKRHELNHKAFLQYLFHCWRIWIWTFSNQVIYSTVKKLLVILTS